LRAISDEQTKDVTNEPENMTKQGRFNRVPAYTAALTGLRRTEAKKKNEDSKICDEQRCGWTNCREMEGYSA
jgi:hypothetical protein